MSLEPEGDELFNSVEETQEDKPQLDLDSVLKEAWELTHGFKWTAQLAFGIYFFLAVGFSLLIPFLLSMINTIAGISTNETVVIATQFISQILIMCVTVPLGVGIFMLGARRAVNEDVKAGDIYDYFPKIVPLMIASILMYLLVFLGTVALILPGIYLVVAYYLATPLIADKGLSPWQALETSRKQVTKVWFKVFALFLIITLFIFISLIPLGLGLIWSIPFSLIAYGIVYRDLFGVSSSQQDLV